MTAHLETRLAIPSVDCGHERAHITDSQSHGHGYATTESRRIFCDVCRLQRWLHVEAALALSQADIGLIPREAADVIAANADIARMDFDAICQDVRATDHSLISLLRALSAACPADAGEYVHFGATTQDIQDTAQALEMREVLDAVDRGLAPLLDHVRELARHHRDTLMVGRTHAQPALPTTFGLKAVGWLDELRQHADHLAESRRRVLVAEMFGGVGTMAGFQGRGLELLKRFAARLDLIAPLVSWHVSRTRTAEFCGALAMLTATLGRIADDVRTLSRPELGEVEEGWEHGQVGSSTMPHKRNPEACEQVVVLARLARASATVALEGMLQEHERDARGLRLEWVAVPDTAHYTLCALSIMQRVVGGLTVHSDRMADHAHQAAESLCTEALMLALARHVGKQTAYARVYEASQNARASGTGLREYLVARPEYISPLDVADLDNVLDPASQVGEAGPLVDRVIERYDGWCTDQAAPSPIAGGP